MRRFPKLKADHWAFLIMIVGIQTFVAWYGRSWRSAMMGCFIQIAWLAIPCADKQFGRKRPFHWIRQTVLIIGAVASLLAAVI